jgi:hypothetical protein
MSSMRYWPSSKGARPRPRVRELGIEPMPLAVYYGLGILPAARIEILDATQVDAMLDRVERKAGLTAARGSLATQDYRRIDLGPVDAVIALSPDYLIAGLLPDDLFEPMLPVLLGVEAPQQNLAEAGTFSELVERHGFEGYGEGFVRLDTLVASLLGRSSGLNAEVMRALGTERVPGSAACLSLVEELVAGMPRMVVGVSDVDERRLGVRGIWEATDAVSGYLRALAAPVPGVGSEHDGLLAMGLGVELPQLRTAIEALLRHVIAHGRECDWVDPDVIEASIPQLSLVLGPMTAGIKGFHLEIDEMSYEDFQPDAIRASLLAAVDDPRGVFALGSMFNPALGALEVPNDGTLVEMPRELVAGQPTPELRVAIKDKALLLVSGDIDQSEADALFAAPTVCHSSLLAQRRVTRRKGTPDLPLASPAVPCASRSRRRSGTRAYGPQSPLARFRLLLRCSASSKGFLVHPYPFGAAEHCRLETDQREDCLSDRRLRVPQRRS